MSSADFKFVRSLGAVAVCDYHSSSVVDDNAAEIKGSGTKLVGVYDAISDQEASVAPLSGVLDKLGGDSKTRFEVSGVLPADQNPYGLKTKFGISCSLSLSLPPSFIPG